MAWSLLHLHGVGQSVHTDTWFQALTESLGLLGVTLPPRDSERIVVPTYDDLLQADLVERTDEPARTTPFSGTRAEALALRARWSRDQARLLDQLPQFSGRGFNGFGEHLDPTTNAVLQSANRDFEDARRYLTDAGLRATVLRRVLASMEGHHDLVVVAHSLGSVVAIDLLNHLPADVHVRRLVTIGSPAGTHGFHKSGPERLLEAKNFPYHQVDGWINVFSPWDPITFGRGLTGLFPAAGDVRVELPRWEHAAHAYLRHPVVATVVAEAVQPVVTGTVTAGATLQTRLDHDEALALDQLVFATLVGRRLGTQNERGVRYHQALTQVASEVGQRLVNARREAARPVPPALTAVATGQVEPLVLTDRPLDQQLLLAVVAATNNPVAPYEIQAAKETADAVRDLWLAYGHPASDAEKVARAVREAAKAFDPTGGWKWVVLGAAGLALIALPPVGIAVGGAGLAGGAALTTGLAAFGPGGMVGGMALAGSLIGIGSASVAASLRLPGSMTPDQLQTHLVRYLGFARAHHLLGLPGSSLDAWYTVAAWHDDVSRELSALTLFSDDNATGVKQARAKAELLGKALTWLQQMGLSPHLTT